MKTKFLIRSIAAACLALLMQPMAHGQLVNFSQDFEALDRTDGAALSNDGWQLFASGINGDATFGNFGAGPFNAPNDINNPSISVISDFASGGAPPAGNQGLVFFSDFNSPLHTDPADPRDLVLSLFQQQTITAADIGSTVTFDFLADGNAAPPTGDAITEAFLSTLDPSSGFITTNSLSFDTTSIGDGSLVNGQLTLDITDSALVGQILQFGFRNTSSDFEGSAVDYDNISFAVTTAAVPEPSSAILGGLFGLCALAHRRRKA